MKVFLFPLLSFLFSSFVFAKNSNFASQTIDLGLVVSDIEKSLKFYKQVVGFEEKEGFKVGGKFPKLVGLTDGANLNIHVLTLGSEGNATKLKLMQVAAQKKSKVVKQPFIHSYTGYSYITIFVHNVDRVLSNAKKHGFIPYSDSPQILPKGLPQDVCLLMLKDPDGNFVEIVGPLTSKLKNKVNLEK